MATTSDPKAIFADLRYVRFNRRRMEHVESLGLEVAGRSVLEVGAGIGDLTAYFADRGCRVTTSDAREQNLAMLRKRYRGNERVHIEALDIDQPSADFPGPFDITFCFGLLYHLIHPAEAIGFLAKRTTDLMLLETVVMLGDEAEMRLVDEGTVQANLSLTGKGCRPTRAWVMREMGRHFEHVYVPVRQPWHEEYTNQWQKPPGTDLLLSRAMFIASRKQLHNATLTSDLPTVQERGEISRAGRQAER